MTEPSRSRPEVPRDGRFRRGFVAPALACARRVEGGILLASFGLPRKLNEVVPDKAESERRVDLTPSNRVTCRLPKRATIIREQADADDEIDKDREPGPKITGR